MLLLLDRLPFIRALHHNGGRVYTVGGTVRDELLGYPRKDLDLLVTGLPQKILIRLLRQYGRVQLIGRAFGVLKFLPAQWHDPPIDIALPRTEVSTGVGHRDFEVTFDHTLPVETDLGRRDFTINAMAWDLAGGTLLDPFGGRADLEQRRLRQVSPAAFPEDPLRMLRGVQLATRFSLTVEPVTYDAMGAHAATITTVAAERIAEELRKLFQAATPARGVRLMYGVGLLRHILPELSRLVGVIVPDPLQHHGTSKSGSGDIPDAFTRTLWRLDAVQQVEALEHRGDLHLLWAALLCDCGLPEVISREPPLPVQEVAAVSAELARQRLEWLKSTTIGVQPALVATLIAHSAFDLDALSSEAALRHFAHDVGCVEAAMVFDLRLADSQGNAPAAATDGLLALRRRLHAAVDRKVPLSLKDLAINGHDLQHLGVPPGPPLGRLLRSLLDRVLDDPTCNTREQLLAAAQATWHREITACGV